MAKIHAFRAYRYTTTRHHHIDVFVAPPYDVVSAEQRRKLAAYSPYNIIHVTLPEGGIDPAGQSPFYEMAASLLAQWREEGQIDIDAEPAITLLRHKYITPDGEDAQRMGFFALTDLVPFGRGAVRPHERTYPGPVADRLALMRACRASLSPVWFFYRDADDVVMRLLGETIAHRGADQRFKMADQQSGEIYILRDPALLTALQRHLAKSPLIIADGHHRYTTTLAYHEESGQDGATPRIFGYFSNLDSPEVMILPTHRGLAGLDDFDENALAARLAEDFDIIPLKEETLPIEAFQRLSLVWCRQDGTDHLLSLKDAGAARLRERIPEPLLADLDVCAFGELVLGRALSMDERILKEGGRLRFYPSESLGRMALERGDLQGLFLMSPLAPAQLGAITEAGLLTPQKTTYFFPKVPSGLLWHPFTED